MRSLWALLIGATLLGNVPGCGEPAPARELVVVPAQYPDSALLFDRRPTYPPAEAMGRSDWPDTASLYFSGEQVYYRETIYDLQGPWNPSRDYTYRRFQMVRSGFGAR